MRLGGLEPPRQKTLEPKSSASASSATGAQASIITGPARGGPARLPREAFRLLMHPGILDSHEW